MDQGLIGLFISKKRKEKGLTQKQLADKLFISEKTISKWECGNGLPEISLMLPLCEILEISVNELLSGKEINEQNYMENAEENLLRILKEKEESRKKLVISFSIAVIGSLVMTVMILVSLIINNDSIKLFLILFGIVTFLLCFINAVILDFDTGIYECKHCKYKFKPSLINYLLAPHIPLKRYLKCPSCGKNGYAKHKLIK